MANNNGLPSFIKEDKDKLIFNGGKNKELLAYVPEKYFDRKIAEVIDTNPDNPKTPVVQLLTEKEADGSLKTLQIGENNINILRILNKQEKEDIKKIIQEKFNSEPAPAAEAQANPAAPVSEPQPAASTQPAEAPVDDAEEILEEQPGATEDVDISIFG
jgi:hypothetical protein